MSQPCAIQNCKRISRALCHCCQENLCREHFNEHADALNNQLNPFVDEINQLNDRLNHINVKNLAENLHEHLNHARLDCYRRIDRYFDEKQQQLDEFINRKLQNQYEGINHVRITVDQLIQRADTTIEDLNSLSFNIQCLRREITQIEYKSINVNILPLEIDEHLVQIDDENLKRDFNLSTLIPPLQTMNRSPESSKPLIANHKHLLLHHDNQLYRCLWTHGWIWDMCWSSTLSRFFIITLAEVFLLDEKTMTLERIPMKEKYALSACTCSETSLYLTTNEVGSSVCEFSLVPTIELINRWQPADLCRVNEIIQDIVFNKGTLGFIIENQTTHTKRMELRLPETFEQLWSVQFDIVDPLHNQYRLCLFNYDEWIVIDWKSSQLFYITKDGQIKSTCTYEPIPYRCCQFGSNMLVISARNSVNFHRL